MTKRVACPKCREQGRDSTGNHLKLYDDSEDKGWCFHCKETISVAPLSGDAKRNYSKRSDVSNNKVDMARVSTLPFRDYLARKISKETMEFFGVRTGVNVEDGSPAEHYYPYFDDYGKVTGYKCRVLPKTFYTVDGSKIKSLFGKGTCQGSKFLIIVEGECFDGSTEVFTDGGWVRLDSYEGQRPLAVNTDDMTARFEDAVAYVKKPYNGKMLSFESRQISFCATPDHNMIVKGFGKNTGLWEKHKLRDGSSQRTVPKTVTHSGEGVPLRDCEIALCLALSADAYIEKSGRVKVTLKKQRKKDRLRAILSECGLLWKEWEGKRGFTEFYLKLPDWCAGRMLPWWWITASTIEQKKLIIEEMVHWDGNHVPNRDQYEYSSKYKENAEWIQTVSHLCGYSSTVISRRNSFGEWFKVSVLKNKSTACYYPPKMTEVSPSDGYVYCVQVSTGAILIRRNGKIMVSGNCDALAAHEMLKHLKPDRRPYNVVSLPLGANDEGTLDPVLRKEMEWIQGFEKVVLILDMDTPGRATAQTIADYLVSSVDVRIASLPLKDTADMWEADRAQDWLDAISNAKKYVSDQVVCGTDTPLKDLLKPIPQGTMYPFLPKTCAKLDGFRPKEMTTLIAPPNVGKSSLFRQMLHHTLLTTDKPVGAFFLEEGIDKTKQSVLAYHAGIPLNKFRKMSQREKENNPLVVEAYETLLPRLHLFEHKRKTLTDDFIERKIEYMVKALGCTDVLFDHLSYVVGGRDSANERKDIDMLMTRLSRSVEDWNYHLFLVSHIKRGGKEKSRREDSQKYPFWEVLDMSDGRGSGSIEQLSHNMVAMEKQILDPALDNTRGLVRTRILRSREWGLTGIADYLTWNEFGQFTPVEGDF